ncbi:1,4-alpha-glucan branching protein GlgB [Corynebacterium sp. H128]|uniref:1,4-alpha-glucan branching protein GlgB n=1 Tax=unclassified Corynebacterium TaxID=2624378 RepID=UPI0030AFBCEF
MTDLSRLLHCQHHDPHSYYGRHGEVIRTRQLGASSVVVLSGGSRYEMSPLGDDIFEATVPAGNYQLEVTWPEATVAIEDPYRFLPTLGELDIHLIAEGRHERLWDVLGSHVCTVDGVSGTSFAVWAPNAIGVAVVGEFNGWNASQHPMRSLGSSGIWELFLPGVGEGTVYKYAIQTPEGHRRDKADPMARKAEIPPATGSIVTASSYEWKDAEWLATREDVAQKPMSVYEVHLGSWKEGLSYADLATELVDYVADQGFTHVEFMPVAEHPFGGSWGYQVSGYYAPTSRWGEPDELRALIDAFHARGIGVLVDWVPAHFPKDDWALARFDGRPVYEHPDWRRGEQKDWGTYVFDFGRPEVRNFLVANALYWLEEFHFDGLRVDAVASMLYLDYSREPGEWAPNQYGGRENLEAVQFLQEMNATVHKLHHGVLTIAEESTSWPGVTAPTDHGGLGFSLKWNMGWMNDTLEYFSKDPIHRSHHHGDITFSMIYQYSENFCLPISHDEVVHGKGTLWTRMPGDTWNKAAGVRTLFAYMWAHPGKQLLFQGQEFAQSREWTEEHSLDWHEFDGWESEYHRGIHRMVRDLNLVYTGSPALYTQDNEQSGFSWVKSDDATNNILAFMRYGNDGQKYLCVFNFGGGTHPNYSLGVPAGGTWTRVINTDDAVYEGAGNDLPLSVWAHDSHWDGYEHCVTLHIPAMSAQWYRWDG